jgi:hypothetical protein
LQFVKMGPISWIATLHYALKASKEQTLNKRSAY